MVSKVFEKVVNNRINDQLVKCDLFYDLQCGSRSAQSTTDLLTFASDRIASGFNRSGTTRAVALDITKALEKVWQFGVLHKI